MIDETNLRQLLEETNTRGGGMMVNVDDKPGMVMLSVERYNELLTQSGKQEQAVAAAAAPAAPAGTGVKVVPLPLENSRQSDLQPIVNFLFEVGILARTPRSGFHFLGSGNQSVSEHICRVMYIGFTLAQMEKGVDVGKVLQMCLFHDVAEARTSDLNYVHQKYAESDEDRALKDLTDSLSFGREIMDLLLEYKERKSREAVLAKEADRLEWILALKEEADTGNTRASTWIPSAIKRLKTESGKALAEKIMITASDDWWFADKENDWWVNRSPDVLKKRF